LKSCIDGIEVRKSSINILDAKSEQKKVRVPKIKKDLPVQKRNKAEMLTRFTKVARKQVAKA